ncbi:MAG TPA: TlpA disulfide reductase family protein [Bryobacteraceae bacterium]|jgi:thiol-disulfide isomerase/thioredoxin|nr:TlpA disulfide reductase family protein [Bryobacteraceae bacterium]
MWLLRTGPPAILFATALLAQPPFAAISDARARAEAVRDARKQLTGRTDPAAIAQWNSVLAEMRLSKDPELNTVVHSLRALNLYHNESWIDLVNMGYAYTGDAEGARQFRNELARRLPDSSWAVQAAMQQWESTHQPRTTTQSGFTEWGLARVKFLKGLHEGKPHSEAATREYLQAALPYESRLPEDEALAVADLALRTSHILPFDPRFQVAQIYLHHHAHLDEVPSLLNDAVQSLERSFRDRLATGQDAESANQRLISAQLRAHSDLAEYWLQKRDIEQARIAARQTGTELMRLAPAADGPPNGRSIFDAEQKLWLDLAKRVGIEAEPVLPVKEVDWTRVERAPLGDFEATDLDGRQWNIQNWKGKVVLVNIWAIWCAPCRAELPYLQKLHEGLHGRANRLVISINVDSEDGLARRLIREHGYTFPVISSRGLADAIDFAHGVPRNRMVDAQGRLLAEPVEGTGDVWVKKVEALMDQVK